MYSLDFDFVLVVRGAVIKMQPEMTINFINQFDQFN